MLFLGFVLKTKQDPAGQALGTKPGRRAGPPKARFLPHEAGKAQDESACPQSKSLRPKALLSLPHHAGGPLCQEMDRAH